jgi:FkbM family methyltransferase
MANKFALQLYKLKQNLLGYHRKSYAQEGEDLILSRLFEGKTQGFYIDIGAHHPFRFSNTYFFYKKGWKGINIDAMPGSMAVFAKKRPKDINLEAAISDVPSQLTYYAFEEPALNTLDPEGYALHTASGSKLLFKKEIKTQRLDEILDKHLPPAQNISFMSVDVEGHDLQVLQSNNWQKYRPNIVLAEVLSKNVKEVMQDKVTVFLEEQGYILVAKSVNTCFFKDSHA